MIPVIALVGRPNVGKSTLFNCLTKTRDALVLDMPGVTRDRQFGDGRLGSKPYIVVDTGGIGVDEVGIDMAMADQSRIAAQDADHIILICEAKVGLTPGDKTILQALRLLNKPVTLVVNKIDGHNPEMILPEFQATGYEPIGIAASQNRGVVSLIEQVLEAFPEPVIEEIDPDAPRRIKIAIAGRPNVGKSTLVNRLLGDERVVVYDQPGTTRDSIYIDFDRFDGMYTFIDTAGVRRRGRVVETLEKFSTIKTLQAIKDAHVVVLVMDAKDGITEQDLKLIGFILEAGKALVVALNKWDGMTDEDKKWIKEDLQVRLRFLPFADIHFISAKHGTGVGNLYDSIHDGYESAMKELATPLLTDILIKAVEDHQPPLVNGRRIKLRYAHCGGHNPPIIVIHGAQTEKLAASYIRYLEGYYRKSLNIRGTPIRIVTKSSTNPYLTGKKELLTPRQKRKKVTELNRRKKRDH